MKNKLIRIFLAMLLSFQLVVRADDDESTGGFFDSFGHAVSNAIDSASEKAKEVGQVVVDKTGNIVGVVIQGAGVIVDKAGNIIGTVAATSVGGKVIDAAGKVWGTLVSLVSGDSGGDPFTMPATGAAKNIIDAAKNAYDAAVKAAQEAIEKENQKEVQKDDDNKDDNKDKDNDNKDDNKNNDNKKKGNNFDPFGKLFDVIKNVAGLFAAGKIEHVIDLLKKVKKIIDMLDKASDIKDLYDDINDLIDQFKDEVNDSDMSDEEKKILNQCADDICQILKEGGDDMDEKLDKVVDKTEDKLVSEEVKETHDDTKDKDKDKDKKDDKKQKDDDKKDDNKNNDDKNDKTVDDLIDIVNDESKPQEEREEAARELAKELEEEGYDQEVVDEANELADKIHDGLVEVGEQLLELAEQIPISKLEEELTPYLGKNNAAAIADYAKKIANGEMTLEEALADGLQQVIDDNLPPNTANAVKELVTAISEGDGLGDVIDSVDDLAQAAAHDAVASLLEQTDLTDEQKQEVLDTIDKLVEGDWEGAWDNAKGGVSDFISNIVEEKFGKEAGEKAKGAIDAILNGDGDSFISNVVDTASTIATDELEKRIGETLDKLVEKYPLLGKVFDALGLNSGGIMDGLANFWNALKDGKLADMIKELVSKITDELKNLAEKLKNFAQNLISKIANTVSKFLNDIVNGLLDKLTDALKTAFAEFVNMFNDLKGQLQNAAGYFLGNENGDSGTLIEMKNNLQNIIQKNVFKTNNISN
ncbi:MAG: hypothetical protein J6X55_08195 [Victivallales bacterium]|nr:hypothetical protein [Victivallales bacterium]